MMILNNHKKKTNLTFQTKGISCIVKHSLSLPSKASGALLRAAKQSDKTNTDYLDTPATKGDFIDILALRSTLDKGKIKAKKPLSKESAKQASKLQKSTMLLLKKGIHLGHKSYRLSKSRSSHPSMCKFLVGSRDSTKIFNNEMSMIFLIRALYIIALVSHMKGGILIINTHPDFLNLVKNRVSFLPWASSANSKWVGGTLTNWKQISKSIMSFAKFSNQYDHFLAENNITYPRYNKMKTCFQGFIDTTKKLTSGNKNESALRWNLTDSVDLEIKCKKKPTLIFLVNPNENRSVIEEARKLDIPIIALANSDTNLSGITYPIPANGCSLDVLHLCFDWIHRVTSCENHTC